jgi:hypothetical protein
MKETSKKIESSATLVAVIRAISSAYDVTRSLPQTAVAEVSIKRGLG